MGPGPPYVLLHGDPVRSCRVCERRIEVELEARIEREAVVGDLDHMDLVIPFEVDLAEVILIEEVIGDHEARVVLGEDDVVRASVQAKVDYLIYLLKAAGMGAIADIQQTDLSRLK